MRSSFSHLVILFLLARASEARASSESPPIQWGPCDPSVVSNPSLSCGFFDIPLDYHDPSAGTGRIYYARYAASPNAARKGAIFVDPGGLRVNFEHLHRVILIYAQIFLFDRLPVRQRGT